MSDVANIKTDKDKLCCQCQHRLAWKEIANYKLNYCVNKSCALFGVLTIGFKPK